jgi:hypothetical protein
MKKALIIALSLFSLPVLAEEDQGLENIFVTFAYPAKTQLPKFCREPRLFLIMKITSSSKCPMVISCIPLNWKTLMMD